MSGIRRSALSNAGIYVPTFQRAEIFVQLPVACDTTEEHASAPPDGIWAHEPYEVQVWPPAPAIQSK